MVNLFVLLAKDKQNTRMEEEVQLKSSGTLNEGQMLV